MQAELQIPAILCLSVLTAAMSMSARGKPSLSTRLPFLPTPEASSLFSRKEMSPSMHSRFRARSSSCTFGAILSSSEPIYVSRHPYLLYLSSDLTSAYQNKFGYTLYEILYVSSCRAEDLPMTNFLMESSKGAKRGFTALL